MRSLAAKYSHISLVCLLLLVVIAGCSPAAKPQSQSPTSNSPTTQPGDVTPMNGYPALETPSGEDNSSAYPAGGDPSKEAARVELTSVKAPAEAPKPEAGKASASGILYSPTSYSILTDFQFYFTPAQGDAKDEVPPIFVGPITSKGDILVTADKKGEFQVKNIPPGNYYIILMAGNDYQIAVTSPIDRKPRMVTFKANTAQPLGVLIFP